MAVKIKTFVHKANAELFFILPGFAFTLSVISREIIIVNQSASKYIVVVVVVVDDVVCFDNRLTLKTSAAVYIDLYKPSLLGEKHTISNPCSACYSKREKNSFFQNWSSSIDLILSVPSFNCH